MAEKVCRCASKACALLRHWGASGDMRLGSKAMEVYQHTLFRHLKN